MTKPAFIPLMSPSFTEADIQAVVDVLRSGMLVQGKNTEALETEACRFTGSKHAVAVSNGTATLHLALLALGIGPGDEVIVPALSYVATGNVVALVGAKPVFVDVHLQTCTMDISLVEASITRATRAIMPVHEFGLSCDQADLMAIADRYCIPVIEDAACALGARERGRHTGTSGKAGSFSFHPRKAITAGEGGLLITDDAALAAQFRVLRNHGIEIVDGQMEFVAPGYNYRMTDFQAALLLSQWPRIDEQVAYKDGLAAVYAETLNPEYMLLPVVPEGKLHSWQTYHIILHDRVDRAALIRGMREAGVGVNYGAQCLPAVKHFADKYKLDSPSLFPNAYKAYTQGLALPIYEKLQAEDIQYISHTLNAQIEKLLS